MLLVFEVLMQPKPPRQCSIVCPAKRLSHARHNAQNAGIVHCLPEHQKLTEVEVSRCANRGRAATQGAGLIAVANCVGGPSRNLPMGPNGQAAPSEDEAMPPRREPGQKTGDVNGHASTAADT